MIEDGIDEEMRGIDRDAGGGHCTLLVAHFLQRLEEVGIRLRAAQPLLLRVAEPRRGIGRAVSERTRIADVAGSSAVGRSACRTAGKGSHREEEEQRDQHRCTDADDGRPGLHGRII